MNIRLMRPEEAPAVLLFLAKCFEDNPVYVYTVPDAQQRADFVRDFLNFRLTVGLRRQAAFVTDNLTGVAIWLGPGQGPTREELVELGGAAALQRVEGAMQRYGRFVAFAGEMEKKLAPMPHHLLSPIAVHPAHQGMGIASAMLKHQLGLFDRDGVTAFLDTQTAGNVALYKKHGFETVFEGVIPETTVPHIAMIRPPRA